MLSGFGFMVAREHDRPCQHGRAATVGRDGAGIPAAEGLWTWPGLALPAPPQPPPLHTCQSQINALRSKAGSGSASGDPGLQDVRAGPGPAGSCGIAHKCLAFYCGVCSDPGSCVSRRAGLAGDLVVVKLMHGGQSTRRWVDGSSPSRAPLRPTHAEPRVQCVLRGALRRLFCGAPGSARWVCSRIWQVTQSALMVTHSFSGGLSVSEGSVCLPPPPSQ